MSFLTILRLGWQLCRCVLPLDGSLVSVSERGAELWGGQEEVMGLCSRQGVQPNHWGVRPQPDKQTLSNDLIPFSPCPPPSFSSLVLTPPDHPPFLSPAYSAPLRLTQRSSLLRSRSGRPGPCGWVLRKPGKKRLRGLFSIIFVWTRQ